MARLPKRKLSKKEIRARAKTETYFPVSQKPVQNDSPKIEKKKVIEIGENVVVRDFASLLNVPVTEVIKILMKNGLLITINETIDWETAAIVGDELGYEVKLKKEKEKITKIKKEDKKNLVPRSPVVTIMGHVDHGKTMLLDVIRETDVVSSESGGITQHIGAYQVNFKGKKITFIDTPGHEAFEVMRAHGANITDIVILVVAAEEGIKPQTIEAYHHAQKAGVPIIVAINKIDLPNANILKVKQQLAEMGLIPEDMGGQTIVVPISAKQKLHINDLLEMILLVAEMKDYRANPTASGLAVVVEAHLDPKLGPVIHALVQNGTFKEGDFIIVGETWGKVRLIEDDRGKRLKSAGPSRPVKIAGLKVLPKFGDILQVVEDEKTAQIVLDNLKKTRIVKGKVKTIFKKEFTVILKADVLGSLAAIKDSLKKLENEEVKINIIRDGAGNITEDDVMMAETTKAKIFGFKVDISAQAKESAERKKVEIGKFDIIYDLIDDIKDQVAYLLKKEEEVQLGRAQILKIFRSTEKEKVVGTKVLSGSIEKGFKFKLNRKDEIIGEGKVLSVQVGKEVVDKVETGSTVGLKVVFSTDLFEGDILEFYRIEFR